MPFIVEDNKRETDRDESPWELVFSNLALMPHWPVCNTIAPGSTWIVSSGTLPIVRMETPRFVSGEAMSANIHYSPDLVFWSDGRLETESRGDVATSWQGPVDVMPEAEGAFRARALLDDGVTFARQISEIVPRTRRITILLNQDPELGYDIPVFRVLTSATVEEIARVEDRVHERLFNTRTYSVFDEVAMDYSFTDQHR